jgi:copper(I)-binding protein
MKAGKMRMRRTESFEIPANGSIDLVHDGMHIMLMQVGAPLQAGTSFPLTLTFENAGTVEVIVKVMGG